jgi:Ca2+-binding EF-hand superfamily protein
MKRCIAALALVFSIAAATPARADAPPRDLDKMVDKVFARLDADHDGRISRAEADKRPRLAKHFAKVDADRDGYVTKPELKAALQARLQQHVQK